MEVFTVSKIIEHPPEGILDDKGEDVVLEFVEVHLVDRFGVEWKHWWMEGEPQLQIGELIEYEGSKTFNSGENLLIGRIAKVIF